MRFQDGDVVVTPLRHLARVLRYSQHHGHYDLEYLNGPDAGEEVRLRNHYLKTPNAVQRVEGDRLIAAIEAVEGRA